MAGEYLEYLGIEMYCYQAEGAHRVKVGYPGERNKCTLATFDAQTRRYALEKARTWIKNKQRTDAASVFFLQQLKPTRRQHASKTETPNAKGR